MLLSSHTLEIPDSQSSSPTTVSDWEEVAHMKEYEKQVQWSNSKGSNILPQSETIPQLHPESTTEIRQLQPEQCNRNSLDGYKSNRHMSDDLFSHSAHRPIQARQICARYPKDHPKAGVCLTCYSTHCLHQQCWNPAYHQHTILRHPQLKEKEVQYQRAVLAKPVQVYGPADQPSMEPVEGWDYLDMSDEFDNDVEIGDSDISAPSVSSGMEESEDECVNAKIGEETNKGQIRATNWLAMYIFPEIADLSTMEAIEDKAEQTNN